MNGIKKNSVIAFVLCMLTVAGFAESSGFVIAPYILNVTKNGATVAWVCRDPATAQVVFGQTKEKTAAIQCEKGTVCTAHLTGLSPNTRYFYQVSLNGLVSPTEDSASCFFTAPDDIRESMSFAVIGDTRTGEVSFGPDHAAVIGSIIRHSVPSLFIHVGDMVDITEKGSWESFFAIESPLIKRCPIYPVRGNSDGTAPDFVTRFDCASKKPWYAFSYGAVRFIMLDLQSKKTPEYYETVIGTSSGQYTWLVNELQSPERRISPFTVVCSFAPFFISHDEGAAVLEKTLCPLFERFGVDLVVSGSAHFFSHSIKNGVSYMITGGGGAGRESVIQTENPRTLYGNSTLHHMRVAVNFPMMTIEAIDNGGTLFFSHVITAASERTVPPYTPGVDDFTLMLFGSPDCEECRTVKASVFPELQKRHPDIPLALQYYNIDNSANFSAYQEIESQLGQSGLAFPVVRLRDRLVSGKTLSVAYLDSQIVRIVNETKEMEKKKSGISAAIVFTGSIFLVAGIIGCIFFTLKRKNK